MQANPFRTLPQTVEIGGRYISIDPDFRVFVALETEMESDEPDVAGVISAFYRGVVPQDVEKAVEKFILFYSCHDGGEEYRPNTESKGKDAGKWYDFAQDADALLASFLDAYGIDLSTAELHWWTFRRLMLNLPPDTPFMQRVKYRTADTSKMTKEERKHYIKMRNIYALKRSIPAMTVEQRDDAMREKMRRRYEEAQRYVEENGAKKS